MASPLLALSLASIAATGSALGSAPAPTLVLASAEEAPTDYDGAVAAVERANIAVNNDPETSLDELEGAIEQLLQFGPEIAASSAGREPLDLSLLNLARAMLLVGDEAGATEIMDQAIRSAHGRDLPIRRFGPTLVEFHDQRRALLDEAGTAAIQVRCRVSCRVVIDAQQATTDSGPLYLGNHRVWVEASDGSEPRALHEIELADPGSTTVIHYPAEEPACEAEPVVVEQPVAPPPPPKRILPRWAEISVVAIGVGAAIAGGVMLGLDGNCPGGLDPVDDAQRCPELYEGTVPGLVAVGIGSALVVAGAVTLSVDEVRVGKQKGRQAMLTWQMKF